MCAQQPLFMYLVDKGQWDMLDYHMFWEYNYFCGVLKTYTDIKILLSRFDDIIIFLRKVVQYENCNRWLR